MPDTPEAKALFAVAAFLRDGLEAHIKDPLVKREAYIRSEGEHRVLVDGEINLHALAGLIARDVLKKLPIEEGVDRYILRKAALP
jgi:hypothetical protein